MTDFQSLLDQILADIASNELELPVLPDVALKIRDLIDDPNVSADMVVQAISNDPAIGTQIIKVANSAAYFGKAQVGNVRDAITRIGFRLLRNVVMAITMGNLFKTGDSILNSKLKQAWLHSQKVAAISYVVALGQKYLNADQAMLAGLIHNIGVLPVCQYLGKNNIRLSADQMDELIRYGHSKVGTVLLQRWNFPHDLIESVSAHEDIHRDSGSKTFADYTDCVLVANLMALGIAKYTAWENVSAIERLGLSKQECSFFLEKFHEQITFAESLLGLATTTRAASIKAPVPPSIQPSTTFPKRSVGIFGFISRLFK